MWVTKRDLLIPRRILAVWAQTEGPAELTLVLDVADDGTVSCQAVQFRSLSPLAELLSPADRGRFERRPLISSDVRIPFDRLVTASWRESAWRVTSGPDGAPTPVPAGKATLERATITDPSLFGTRRRAYKRVPMTHAHLERVAKLYRDNLDENPLLAICDFFRDEEDHPVSRSTANRWVQKAREAGVLHPSLGQGRKGEASTKETNR